MFGRRRKARKLAALFADCPPLPQYPTGYWPETTTATPTASASPRVDDFLPPDLRVNTGMNRFMEWGRPLVLDGEVRTCPQCEAYRDWVVLCTQGQIWLHCRYGHQSLEPRLNVAWYNRHSGPVDSTFDTLDEGLRHLGR
ncbi:hypothetical protein A8W25_30855 [Streptomyces sp. ERV7]|uniref:hypothetical protein n=1 Tax=Streptomyces sp. ERV7 TaxID=1322334 RepID=UPI0007F4932D|nr:hypothetical protein [Streptomyces sp. ERV7]OAR21870.1 hypothetical protein A8W25_30855 [Streptomyces sp. ERV7]